MNLENKKQLMTLVLAAGLGLVAAFLTSQYVQTSMQREREIVAKQYEQKSMAIVQEMDAIKNELKTSLANQAAMAQQLKQIQSQPPQVVMQGVSTEPGQEGIDTTVFSELTPPGKRAITLLIDSLSAVGGLVNPGDFVDVVAELKVPHPTDPEGDPEEVTTVLFQNLQVLAVGTNFKPIGNSEVYAEQSKTRQLNVTLAVDPEEAGLITFAQKGGKLQLVLRSPSDLESQVLQVASWEQLSDYVLDRQGTELIVPAVKAEIKESEKSSEKIEVKPYIQIFRGGQEL